MIAMEGDGAPIGKASGIPLMGLRNDALTDRTSVDATYAALAVDAKGRLMLAALSAAAALADGATVPTVGAVGAVGMLYNGATLDLQRGNMSVIVLASAARTTAQSVDLTNYNARGVLVFLNVTAASGTGGLTVRVRARDPISGAYYQLNNAPTGITATTAAVYMFYPGVTATNSNANQVVSNVLPRDFNIQVAVGDASSYTYSISASLIV